MGSQIVDTTLMPAPKQRNTEDEKTAMATSFAPLASAARRPSSRSPIWSTISSA